LPYDYGAVAPHISSEIMQLHHSKHHQTYVNALNQTLDKLAPARDKGDFGAIAGLAKTLAFNLGGHVNHSASWQHPAPDGGASPTGELAAATDEHFGSFGAFPAHSTAAATSSPGAGWAIRGWDTPGERLLAHPLYDQQANLPAGQVPIVLLYR